MALSENALRQMRPVLAVCPNSCARDFADTRDRWLAGRCLCCAGPADQPGLDGTAAEAIAEGVIMCGQCVQERHMEGGVGELLLLALLP